MKRTTKVQTASLPADVVKADTVRPKWDDDTALKWNEAKEIGLESAELTFYRTESLGWVLITLLIGKSRSASSDRYYGVMMNGSVCRVGKGPHVKEVLTVHLTKTNLPRLQKYVDLYMKGLEAAGTIRDRIGSRRAQGQLERAAGNRFWRWDS